MSDLQNQTPADTYKGLLQVNDYTNGVDATAKYIQDGEGTDSALAISTDKVGIGTDSPSANLEAYTDNSDEYDDDSYANPVLKITNANTTAAIPHSLIAFRLDKNGGDGYLGFITDGSTANTQHFVLGGQGSGEHLRIDSNGNVGIATTNPSAPLTIGGSPYPYMSFDNTQTDSVDDTILGTLFFKGKQPDGTLDTGVAIRAKGAGTATNSNNDVPAQLVFSTNPGGTGGLVERMVVDSSGNVGIGTTSPSAPLEVASTTGGVIMPRMNDSQRNAISSPTNGEMIFNTSTNKLNVYNGTEWRELTDTDV